MRAKLSFIAASVALLVASPAHAGIDLRACSLPRVDARTGAAGEIHYTGIAACPMDAGGVNIVGNFNFQVSFSGGRFEEMITVPFQGVSALTIRTSGACPRDPWASTASCSDQKVDASDSTARRIVDTEADKAPFTRLMANAAAAFKDASDRAAHPNALAAVQASAAQPARPEDTQAKPAPGQAASANPSRNSAIRKRMAIAPVVRNAHATPLFPPVSTKPVARQRASLASAAGGSAAASPGTAATAPLPQPANVTFSADGSQVQVNWEMPAGSFAASDASFRVYERQLSDTFELADIPWSDPQQTRFTASVTRTSSTVSYMEICAFANRSQACSGFVAVTGGTAQGDPAGGIGWGQPDQPYGGTERMQMPPGTATLPQGAPSSFNRGGVR